MRVLKLIRSISIMGLVLPVFISGMVFAQTTDTTATTAALEARIAATKARLQTRLTTAEQTRLKARCKASQVIIRQFGGRVTSLENNRKNAHKKILEELNSIVTKYGDNADTTELQAAIATLKTKTDAMDTSLATYKQSVSDLAEMDCVADPAAFQATLNDVRSQRADLAKAGSDIRAYFRDTIKPLLQSLRTTIKAKAKAQ